MMASPLVLDPTEISLIKGLRRHLGFSQQKIVAYFTQPGRTVHANTVSDIIAGAIYADEAEASPEMCRHFLEHWNEGYQEHSWALISAEIARAPYAEQLEFTYRYHPVGQGMFCSGSFTREHDGPFRWVYDCGVEKGTQNDHRADHVRREIDDLAREQSWPLAANPHLDLVTLSHFDEDHLSGLVDLVSRFTVGTLRLPYLKPWRRLVVALQERAGLDSDLFAFLTAPTAFLLARFEGRVQQIILVPGNDGGEAAPPLLPLDGPRPEGREDEFRAMKEPVGDEAEPEPDAEGLGADAGLLRGQEVRMLRPGTAITIGRAWEFLPYNDERLAHQINDGFKDEARPLAAKVRDHTLDEDSREEALDALIALYDKRFKTPGSGKISARRRNEISLFLYSGPIGRVSLDRTSESVPRHRICAAPAADSLVIGAYDRFGQMFTGDGYLQTPRQWDEFSTFYRPHGRLRRAGFFQVMHHGSSYNWHAGLAGKLSPIASIFCSDPAGHLRHPHHRVLADFAGYNPKQIDAFHGWRVHGRYSLLT
jgi:hypothetical protein